METTIDEYWTRSEEIGRLLLPPRDIEQDVSFIWHQSREKYGRNHREIGLGTLKEAGERDYVHAKAVFYVPDIILTVELAAPGAESELGTEIGEVVGSKTRGQTRHEFANCQAWYYPSERVLMLWEMDLFGNYAQESDPTQDFLLACLWDSFEQALLAAFPNAQTVLTPHEPDYAPDKWRAFLAGRGYEPHKENTYIKALVR